MKFITKSLVFCFFLFIFSCNSENKTTESINIFAATSTTKITNEICDSFALKDDVKIYKNFAATGTLSNQIVNGADCDIFLSADKKWIDFLKNNNLLVDTSINILAKNKLVIICPINNNLQIEFNKNFDILSTVKSYIAIGDPEYVPVGNYAKQVLDTLDWYNKLNTKIIKAKDVASVLKYVELGECDWGIVYYTEAILSDKVKIVCQVPDSLHKPVEIYIALLKNASEKSLDLYKYFTNEKAKNILIKNGFEK